MQSGSRRRLPVAGRWILSRPRRAARSVYNFLYKVSSSEPPRYSTESFHFPEDSGSSSSSRSSSPGSSSGTSSTTSSSGSTSSI